MGAEVPLNSDLSAIAGGGSRSVAVAVAAGAGRLSWRESAWLSWWTWVGDGLALAEELAAAKRVRVWLGSRCGAGDVCWSDTAVMAFGLYRGSKAQAGMMNRRSECPNCLAVEGIKYS